MMYICIAVNHFTGIRLKLYISYINMGETRNSREIILGKVDIAVRLPYIKIFTFDFNHTFRLLIPPVFYRFCTTCKNSFLQEALFPLFNEIFLHESWWRRLGNKFLSYRCFYGYSCKLVCCCLTNLCHNKMFNVGWCQSQARIKERTVLINFIITQSRLPNYLAVLENTALLFLSCLGLAPPDYKAMGEFQFFSCTYFCSAQVSLFEPI